MKIMRRFIRRVLRIRNNLDQAYQKVLGSTKIKSTALADSYKTVAHQVKENMAKAKLLNKKDK
ncbi:MAG: hypothetical protein UX68_C0004G0022 [Parcubacteria group bacterium GW2011_GWA2_46_9]|nr:MAG: hypothetical protein UX68_C0004G0022 [Parcubacteria group bacterium GW2011_GWA2_46_9]